ncbi:hypothetical protein B0J15DRAFT_473007 [Fusarium solani]|uniref:Uncharacterized protein n=1 Tax=Fusarium solani TaxID=169388 RepID=A0A9P9JMM6_FUSSL|nr:uncharacterized protein B0J15DRAFT_473007 [Fusarium solani]KAH7230368.1 hypothetical protein B0J15DRAFT_473007 [Fusarium solani]
METLKAAEGRTGVDEELMDELNGQPAPGDVDVDAPLDGKMFGIPDPEDPDPYGVLALEKEGIEVHDAATRSRPSSQQFEYNPSPSSPIYNKVLPDEHGDVGDEDSRMRSSTDPSYTTSEAGTQTEPVIVTPILSSTPHRHGLREEDEPSIYEDVGEIGSTRINRSPYSSTNDNPWNSEDRDSKDKEPMLVNEQKAEGRRPFRRETAHVQTLGSEKSA